MIAELSSQELEQISGYAEAMTWIKSGSKRLFIGGAWVDALSRRQLETVNPATEERLTDIALAGKEDVDRAVVAAQAAFEQSSWSALTPMARGKLLLDIADAIEAHANELAVLETLDNGTPLVNSRNWVRSAVNTFRYYAGWPSKILGTTVPTEDARFIYSLREPVGVCALINPWNAPFTQAAGKIAPALACGNTAILKPSELTSLSTLRLAEVIQQTDLPKGVLNILTGTGAECGAALVEHPGIGKVAFTGSTAVGRSIMQAASMNFKKITLELGGKSPNIIFEDADMELALAAAVGGFCRNSGQICSAGTRLFVHQSHHDELVERVVEIASSHVVGSPFASASQMGPVISKKQMNTVLSYVDIGQQEGARLALPTERVGDKGFFLRPAVFSHVRNDMRIAQEEIFGPVVSIIPFSSEEEAVRLANDSIYGLASAVWTRDVSRAHRVARKLQSGRVWINTYGEVDAAMSMGGYKQSGLGRENGAESIEAYTQSKSVLMRI